jgi:L-lactate dehydrogenase (cytochrome)
MKPGACRNIADLRKAAFRRLPAPMYHFLEGGAEDERTVRANKRAFADYAFVPTPLNDVSTINTRTTLFGRDVSLPLMLSPTGASELFHHTSERAVARAAANADIFFASSCMGTTELEDVAGVGEGPRVFQIKIFKDRGLTRELVERAQAAGFDALCLTIDSSTHANRERDLRTGLTVPPKLTGRSILSVVTHPSWSIPALFHSKFRLANFEKVPGESSATPAERVARLFDRSLSWKDVEWLFGLWNGPTIVKGISAPQDALNARDAGAKAVMISNHGGRQLADTIAPLRALLPIRDAVGSSIQLIVDGGVRRGTDVIKAIALGADACSMGRPYVYGLAAFGEAGVDRAITIMRTEIERSMALLGCASLSDIKPEHVVRFDGSPVRVPEAAIPPVRLRSAAGRR